jgi:hypothetical protein
LIELPAALPQEHTNSITPIKLIRRRRECLRACIIPNQSFVVK